MCLLNSSQWQGYELLLFHYNKMLNTVTCKEEGYLPLILSEDLAHNSRTRGGAKVDVQEAEKGNIENGSLVSFISSGTTVTGPLETSSQTYPQVCLILPQALLHQSVHMKISPHRKPPCAVRHLGCKDGSRQNFYSNMFLHLLLLDIEF